MAGSNETVDYYSTIASEFDASYGDDANRLERLRVWRHFLDRHAPGAQTAYDLGCGSGVLTLELVRRGIATTAVDGSAAMLELAKEKVAGQAVAGVTFEQRLLPFDPGSHQPADLVVCSSVIEYLDSVDDALKTFRTLLREGGTLIYSISNRDSLSRRLVRVVNAATGRPRYFRLLRHMLSEEEVVEVTTRAGFTVLEHAYFGAADVLNRLLGTILPARRASNMLIVAARRD